MKKHPLRITVVAILLWLICWSIDGVATSDQPQPSPTGADAITERPAETAAPRATPRLGAIGVILPTLDAPYYTTLLNCIKDEAAQNGFDIRSVATDQAGDEQKALDTLLSAGVQSMIIDPNDIGEASLSALTERCLAAGVPCVTILDNEEPFEEDAREGRAVAVPVPASGAGFYMMNQAPDILGGTVDILDGRLLIIASQPDDPVTKENVAGLYFDSDGTILNRKHIKILKTLYVTDKKPLDSLVDGALKKYKKVDTIICIAPEISYDLLSLLQVAGFHGNLLCYTDEITADRMEEIVSEIRVVYVYTPVARIAEESFNAAMMQAIFGYGYDGSCYLFIRLSKTAE